MLEIVILIVLAGKIGKIVESKGRKKTGYQIMLIGFWFGGELFGAILGGIIGAIATESEDGGVLFAVLFAYVFAIVSAVIAFQIAKHLEPLDSEEEFYRPVDVGETWRDRQRSHSHDVHRPAPDDHPQDPERSKQPPEDRIQQEK